MTIAKYTYHFDTWAQALEFAAWAIADLPRIATKPRIWQGAGGVWLVNLAFDKPQGGPV